MVASAMVRLGAWSRVIAMVVHLGVSQGRARELWTRAASSDGGALECSRADVLVVFRAGHYTGAGQEAHGQFAGMGLALGRRWLSDDHGCAHMSRTARPLRGASR